MTRTLADIVVGGFLTFLKWAAVLAALLVLASIAVKVGAPGYAAALERTLFPLLPEDPAAAELVAAVLACSLVAGAWLALARRRKKKQ